MRRGVDRKRKCRRRRSKIEGEGTKDEEEIK